MLMRLLNWLMDRFGMSFDDGQSTSPLCKTCGHQYDSHSQKTYAAGEPRPCFEVGCDCPDFVPE